MRGRWQWTTVLISSLVTCVGVALAWPEPALFTKDWSSEPEADGSEETFDEAVGAADASATDLVVGEQEMIEAEKPEAATGAKRPWQATVFSGQEGALGWSESAFEVPEPMKERVAFWRDIYTKYSTDEGLIHDSQHVGIVYRVVDFRPIMENSSLTDRQKSRARRKLVDDAKKEICDRLKRLQSHKDPTSLTGEDLRVWELFAKAEETGKFIAATHRKRLRFQLGQRDRFIQGIYYSGRYLREMEQIFREKGMPIELTRLPFVESSFNVKARSRVGASGIWQFMRYTGKRFMRIHGAVDERNDPIRATEAAARLLRLNFEMLQKWPLAVTGYNHGPAGVQRVVRKFRTDNISELVDERHGRFGFASANFYACFLAAIDVERNADKYFGNAIHWDSAMESREIRLATSLHRKWVLRWFGDDLKKAQEYNPHLSAAFWRGFQSLTAKDYVRVPTAKYELALSDLRSAPTRAEAAVAREVAGSDYHLISHGETLSGIALQLGVNVQLLKELNGIENPRMIRPGQKLVVPKAKD